MVIKHIGNCVINKENKYDQAILANDLKPTLNFEKMTAYQKMIRYRAEVNSCNSSKNISRAIN